MSARDWSDLDFDKSGRQLSWIRIGHSITRSGYGVIPIPVAVFKNGEGPTVLVQAGCHGDEYEGQIAVSRLINQLDVSKVSGRIIAISAANPPAVVAGARVSPIDEGNLNRLFPGDEFGTPTQRIAHFIHDSVLPMCDAVVDMHAGGTSMELMIYCAGGTSGDAALDRRMQGMLDAFNAPVSLTFKGMSGGGNLSQVAREMGIPSIAAELGGGGGVNVEATRVGEGGIYRVLDHLGVLPLDEKWRRPDATQPIRIAGNRAYTYVYDAGVFEHLHPLGAIVAAGEVAGYLHHPENPQRAPEPIRFEETGLLYCRRAIGRVQPGDCVAHLAVAA